MPWGLRFTSLTAFKPSVPDSRSRVRRPLNCPFSNSMFLEPDKPPAPNIAYLLISFLFRLAWQMLFNSRHTALYPFEKGQRVYDS